MSDDGAKSSGEGRCDARVPVDDTNVRIKPYSGPAAGLGAVKSIAVQGVAEVGPVRSLQLLRKINQKGGFDCPGCAWPDPLERTP